MSNKVSEDVLKFIGKKSLDVNKLVRELTEALECLDGITTPATYRSELQKAKNRVFWVRNKLSFKPWPFPVLVANKKVNCKHNWSITEDAPFIKYCTKCGCGEDGNKI